MSLRYGHYRFDQIDKCFIIISFKILCSLVIIFKHKFWSHFYYHWHIQRWANMAKGGMIIGKNHFLRSIWGSINSFSLEKNRKIFFEGKSNRSSSKSATGYTSKDIVNRSLRVTFSALSLLYERRFVFALISCLRYESM